MTLNLKTPGNVVNRPVSGTVLLTYKNPNYAKIASDKYGGVLI